jgi:hypothetical protein
MKCTTFSHSFKRLGEANRLIETGVWKESKDNLANSPSTYTYNQWMHNPYQKRPVPQSPSEKPT